MRLRHLTLIPVLLSAALAFSARAGWEGLLGGKARASGVVAPVYVSGESQPVATFRANRIHVDYQRRGFFRIGLLPMGVMEGVTFDIAPTAHATNSLAQAHGWLHPGAGRKCAEIRGLVINFPGNTPGRLEAARARLSPDGQWELFDRVTWQTGTNRLEAPTALLQVTGPRTGELRLGGTSPVTLNLFASVTTSTTPPPSTP